MSVAWPEGEREATIIPFPLHRVSDAPSDSSIEALVHELEVDIVSREPEAVSPRVSTRAHNVSVHALSGKSHSVAEMREKLLARELPEDVVEEEIGELLRVGLLDDGALARDLVERYASREGLAKRAVWQKLRARKIPVVHADSALAELEDDREGDLCEDAARERLRKMGSLAPAVAKRRLFSYLQRKGFSSSDIVEALAKVLG